MMILILVFYMLCIKPVQEAPIPPNLHTHEPTYDETPPIIGFDCNQTEPEILTVSTLEIKECPEISKMAPMTQTTYGQIIQMHEIDSVHIMTCQLTKSTSYFRCGANWYNYNVYPPSIGVLQEVTSKNCQKLHESGFYKWNYNKEPWSDLAPNKTYYFSINELGWTSTTGYCEGGTVEINGQTFKDIVVQSSFVFSIRESFGKVDFSSGKLNIEGGLSCNYKDGNCFDSLTGTHVWTPKNQRCPEDKYRLLYEGKVNITSSKEDPTILLSIHNTPFLFTSELGSISYTCGISLQFTEFPNVFYAPQRDGVYQLKLEKPGDDEIKFLTYLNSKITFLYHNLMDSMQKMYLSSLHATCQVEREMLKNRIEIIRLNSASGGLSSLLKPGMFAKVNGEIIHLIKCKPVGVTFRNTKICYDALPIIHKNENVFLLPNTHIISPYAAQIECSPISPVTYRIGGTWWSFTGNYQRVPDPVILAPSTDLTHKFQKIRSFGKGGMYSEDQVEAIQKLLTFPQLRESITTEFVRGVTHLSTGTNSMDITTIMSEYDWKAVAKRNIENVWGYFSGIGSAISGLIGIYFIYRLIKGAINCLIDSHELYKVFGCSLYLLSSVWTRLALYFINKARNTTTTTQTSTPEPQISSNEIDDSPNEMMPLQATAPISPFLHGLTLSQMQERGLYPPPPRGISETKM